LVDADTGQKGTRIGRVDYIEMFYNSKRRHSFNDLLSPVGYENRFSKRLDSVLQLVKEQQKAKSIERSKSAPQRRGQQRVYKEIYRKINPAAQEQRNSTTGHF